jgi:hypothetical protein
MENDSPADDGQFESGYSEPTETPAQAKQPEVKEAVAEPVDPLQAVIARLDKFEASHSTLAGHIGGLQRSQKDMQSTLAAAQAATKTVSDAPTQAQVKDAMTNPAEWDALKNEFPEWATATEKYMDAKLATLRAPQALDPAAIEKIVGERVAGESAAVRKEIIDASLDAVFPDWQVDVKTPAFAAWLKTQPAAIADLGASEKVGDAARMLKLYEMSKQAKPVTEPIKQVSTRQKRIEAAINPKGAGGHAAGSSDVDEFESGESG